MEIEVSELVFNRFLEDLRRVAPEEEALIASLAALRESGDLEKDAALVETYRRLAARS